MGLVGPSTQQNTSISRVFVLGALVPAMLLATWWVRPPSMAVGVGNPTTAAKQHSTFSSYHKQCFQMDVPPVAQRVSNNYADQGRLFFFYGSTLAICEFMSRLRAVMTPEESCVLKPFVTSRSWLVYDESAKVSETKLHKENALKHVALDGLHEHLPSLVLTRSVVSAALRQLVVQFGVSPDSSKDCLETMANRLQNLCKTVSQSLRKNPRSEFAASFPWSPTGYIAGYDRELRSAWRRLQDGTGPAEMSSPLFVPEGAQPTDSPMARWSVGFEHTVTDITCEELQATAAADNKRDKPTVVWWDPLREQTSSVRETETRQNTVHELV